MVLNTFLRLVELLLRTPIEFIIGPFNGSCLGLYTALLSSLRLPLALIMQQALDGPLPDRFHSEAVKAFLSEILSSLVIDRWIDETYDRLAFVDSFQFCLFQYSLIK
jgi:hypothetical protein